MKKKNLRMLRSVFSILTLVCILSGFLNASAATVDSVKILNTRNLADGVTYKHMSGNASAGKQNIYTVEYSGKDSRYGMIIGGNVYGRKTVPDMSADLVNSGRYKQVLAGINGDHFSFSTGVPLGFSVSNGEILTSTIEPYDADEYYFHTLGIKKDGSVLAGENPTLNAKYTVKNKAYTIERINRTRETWEGGQLCLYTPAYGASTNTAVGGVELVIKVKSGGVSAGGSLVGNVVSVVDEGNAKLEEGTVVLSGCLNRYPELTSIAVGTEISMSFTFQETEWNDVRFSIGGHYAVVQNGKPMHKNYKISVFSGAQPRSALGIKKDGTIVMMAVDGRSSASTGMTANEMADYLAYDIGCQYAILLDGGGSTAMAAAVNGSNPVLVNVPSETRAVGNGVFIVANKAANATTSSSPKNTTTGKSPTAKQSNTSGSAQTSESTASITQTSDRTDTTTAEMINSDNISDKTTQKATDVKSDSVRNGNIGFILLGTGIGLFVLAMAAGIYFLVLWIKEKYKRKL